MRRTIVLLTWMSRLILVKVERIEQYWRVSGHYDVFGQKFQNINFWPNNVTRAKFSIENIFKVILAL